MCDCKSGIACIADTCTGHVNLTSPTGHIQVGVFVDGKGQQRYAPGEDCSWTISVANAKNLSLTFTSVATGFDRLDHIDVYEVQAYAPGPGVAATPKWVLKTSISEQGLDKHLQLHIEGAEAFVRFTSFGGSSPYNEATGFRMQYKAGKNISYMTSCNQSHCRTVEFWNNLTIVSELV